MASSSSTKSGGINRRVSSSNTRDGTAKAMVAEHISQAVQSTSNLLHLMQQSSPSQAYLVKLPKNLLSKTSTIKNTAQVLEKLPQVISSLDAHTEDGLQRVPHLKTVVQLLSNMESSQLNSVFQPTKYPEVNQPRVFEVEWFYRMQAGRQKETYMMAERIQHPSGANCRAPTRTLSKTKFGAVIFGYHQGVYFENGFRCSQATLRKTGLRERRNDEDVAE